MAYLKRKRHLVSQFISLSTLAKITKVILGLAMRCHHMMGCVKRRRANCANFRAFSEPPIDLQPSTHGLRHHQHFQTWRSGAKHVISLDENFQRGFSRNLHGKVIHRWDSLH